jgi:hypothetical protein
MARHDIRDEDGKFTERDIFDLSDRIPKAGSAARGEYGAYASLSKEISFTGTRVASVGNSIDGLDHPAAGSASGRDYANVADDFGMAEDQNRRKAPSSEVRRARDNDWVGPQAPRLSAYNTGPRGRDDGSSGW